MSRMIFLIGFSLMQVALDTFAVTEITTFVQIPADTGRTKPMVKKERLLKKVSQVFNFSGFIKYDLFVDTRQTVNAREGLVTMYPANRLLDANGRDVNAGVNMNMLSIHSRLACSISGPEFLGARSVGLVEADFYGNENGSFSDLNGLRLFNAYIKLNWQSTELMVGQDWHPMSIPGFFPGVVSFSAGAPFHPMSRNPQIRVAHSLGKLKLMGALLSQRDFTSTGPQGPGSQYLRNSGLPNVHFQLQYNRLMGFSGGVGVDYKRLVPELYTKNKQEEMFDSGKGISSSSILGFLSFSAKNLSLKAQGVYAENGYDQLMLGGYGETGMSDPQTGAKGYTNLRTASLWLDAQLGVDRVSFGMFGGYTRNMGSSAPMNGIFYVRGLDIYEVYRLAPRLAYTAGPVAVALEGEYTSASYGTANGNGKGGVTGARSVANVRSLLSIKYLFK